MINLWTRQGMSFQVEVELLPTLSLSLFLPDESGHPLAHAGLFDSC